MDPAVIFDRRVRKAAPKNNEIIQKKYIVPQKMFQFGPLLVGRTRDKTKPFKHVENFDKIWISNDGYLPAEISLSFRKESSNPIFSLETQKMSLQLGWPDGWLFFLTTRYLRWLARSFCNI